MGTGTLGFSVVGLCFLLVMVVPNLFYLKFPAHHKIMMRENPVLVAFERVGQVSCTICLLIFSDLDIGEPSQWNLWAVAAGFCMFLYLICWYRYFAGEHSMYDFTRPLMGFIPVPLATLPVVAILCLAMYGHLIWLLLGGILLGIGHIGITWRYWKAVKRRMNAS